MRKSVNVDFLFDKSLTYVSVEDKNIEFEFIFGREKWFYCMTLEELTELLSRIIETRGALKND